MKQIITALLLLCVVLVAACTPHNESNDVKERNNNVIDNNDAPGASIPCAPGDEECLKNYPTEQKTNETDLPR